MNLYPMPPEVAGPRRSTWGPRIAALVILVVLGGVTYLSSRDASPDAAGGIPLPNPASIERDGETFVAQQLSPPTYEVEQSGGAITLYVFEEEEAGDSPECSSYDSSARVVEETAETVSIAAFSYVFPARPAEFGCSYTGPVGQHFPYDKHTLELDRPLGDRLVVDSLSGRTIGAVVGLTPPAPTYVPAGFKLAIEVEAGPVPFWGQRSYTRGGRNIDVMLRSETSVHAEGPGSRCVSWSEKPGIQLDVCSRGTPLLPEAELQRIADSMPRLP